MMARLAKWMLARAFPAGAHLVESGADGIRTHDLLRARQALSQLSYRPSYSGAQIYPAASPSSIVVPNSNDRLLDRSSRPAERERPQREGDRVQ
jgi:hypothetical protein